MNEGQQVATGYEVEEWEMEIIEMSGENPPDRSDATVDEDITTTAH